MEANRALPKAIPLSLGVLISAACIFALLVGIAHLMPRLLSFWQSPSARLAPAIPILAIAAGSFLHRRRKRHAAQH
jgi:hypothetical protein